MSIEWGDAAAVAGPWAITFGLFVSMFVAVQKGWLVPGKAHLREIASREVLIKSLRDDRITEMATMRAEHLAEMADLRERNDTYMKATDANHARETEGLRKDSDSWRGAWHLASEVGKVQAAPMDELVENSRLTVTVMEALDRMMKSAQPGAVNNVDRQQLPGEHAR